MMHSVYGQHTPGPLPLSHPHDAFFDDASSQMSVPRSTRRLSPGSNGQRSGSAMRVAKPNSASNSPRSSTMINRRRTVINDGQMQRRSQQIMDYLSTPRGNDMSQPTPRPARPVSWHPSTYLQLPQLQYQQQYQQPANANMYDQQDQYLAQPHFSPMMTSYSNDTSPSSTFSPLHLNYPNPEPSQYMGSDGWDMSQRSTHPYPGANDYNNTTEMFPSLPTAKEQQHASNANGLDWNSFIMRGFNNTSPPTPETFLQPQQSQPTLSEDAVPYQALEDAEEEGEILVGMGLYDTPEKSVEDPQLNNYRSTVSSLLGSTFRPTEGKGLKLEETWEPPKSDDEEEDGEDSDDEPNAGEQVTV